MDDVPVICGEAGFSEAYVTHYNMSAAQNVALAGTRHQFRYLSKFRIMPWEGCSPDSYQIGLSVLFVYLLSLQ